MRENIPFTDNRVLHGLLVALALIWGVCAVSPFDRFDWFLENILFFAYMAGLILTYRHFVFSNLSYALIAVFFSLHLIGSHYTYALTPPGVWLQDMTGGDRNHYDRVIHFFFGLLITYPLREVFLRATDIRGFFSWFLPFAMILAMGDGYEIIEWGVANVVDPDAAHAYLGTQGDIFDAQKDTASGALGSLIALALIYGRERLFRPFPLPP